MVSLPTYTVNIRHPITFDVMADIDDFLSLKYKRNAYDLNTFELTISGRASYKHIARTDNAVVEIIRNGYQELIGRVKVIRLRTDPTLGMVYTLSGIDFSDLLRSRLALPAPLTTTDQSVAAGEAYDELPDLTNGADAMWYFINRNLAIPYETARQHAVERGIFQQPTNHVDPNLLAIPYETINYEFIPMSYIVIKHYKARYNNLLDVVRTISKSSGIMWNLRVNTITRTIYFDTYGRANRTETNIEGYQPVVFSLDNQNIEQFEYERNGLDTKDTIYVGGSGEADTRTVVTFIASTSWQSPFGSMFPGVQSNPSGQGPRSPLESWINPDPLGVSYTISEDMRTWGRQEAFVTVKEGSTRDELEATVLAYLQTHQTKQSIKFQPNPNMQSLYKIHWDVGDIVTFRYEEEDLSGDAPIEAIEVQLAANQPETITLTMGQVSNFQGWLADVRDSIIAVQRE
jgi:hypothetical protein